MYDPLWEERGISLWMKRDDLIHPVISGNKYRKLEFLRPLWATKKYKGILSFGGAFSNHIHALAYFCHQEKIPLTVMVRSYAEVNHSPTLSDLQKWGAEVRTLSPTEFRLKEDPERMARWSQEYSGYLIIPEGGSHPAALRGVSNMMTEIREQISPVDYFVCPVGTGATLAGMIQAKCENQWVIGISSLKSSTMYPYIRKKWQLEKYEKWTVADQWHMGGYGHVPDGLVQFIQMFDEKQGIRLDPLYNGKAMYAFYQYVKHGLIPSNATVVFLHTGGLQGWRGVEAESNPAFAKASAGKGKVEVERSKYRAQRGITRRERIE